MVIKFGNVWAVLAHGRFSYFKRRPADRTVRSVVRRHRALLNA